MLIDNIYYVFGFILILKCIVLVYGHHDVKLFTVLRGRRRVRFIPGSMSHPRFFRASVEAHYHGHIYPDTAHQRCSGDQAC